MQKKRSVFSPEVLKVGGIAVLVLALVLAIMGWVVGDDWSSQSFATESVSQGFMAGTPMDGDVIEQGLSLDCEYVDGITLSIAPMGTEVGGTLTADVLQGDQTLASKEYNLSELYQSDNSLLLEFPDDTLPVGRKDVTLRLTLHTDGETNLLPAFWVGNKVDTGRIALDASNLDRLTVNGEALQGQLCMTVVGHSRSNVMAWYWPICGALVLMGAALVLICAWKRANGKQNFLLLVVELLDRYRFLIRQLVSRDFNTKYRQSVLGVLWSFLNPLLTMGVQYIVFSTIFRSSIANFPVYLMTGIVLFNYFSEATSLGLDSIVVNASLITKVYMPKYIYPLSRTLSSLINLLISLVPLLLMMLVTGVPLTKALLLTPLVILFVFTFSLGMSMLLATMNVFFRDTRFLWSVVVLIWTYLTPIFYPESIIPAQLIGLYHMNPMYQFIYFMRCITLGGIAPNPITYLYCTLGCVIPLLIGVWVFRKNQDRFVFYL